jgi:hypothetical protein
MSLEQPADSTGAPVGTGSPGAPWAGEADSTTEVLAQFRSSGIAGELSPGREPASLRCSACGQESAAAEFEVLEERRLEGASDPDDMVMVVGARCPACQAAGAVVLAYGPEASATDTDLVLALAR